MTSPSCLLRHLQSFQLLFTLRPSSDNGLSISRESARYQTQQEIILNINHVDAMAAILPKICVDIYTHTYININIYTSISQGEGGQRTPSHFGKVPTSRNTSWHLLVGPTPRKGAWMMASHQTLAWMHPLKCRIYKRIIKLSRSINITILQFNVLES